MNCLDKFSTPQLEFLHRGKVRDSLRINAKERLIVVTDRISAFNKNSKTPIPHKGAILNGITNFWFEKTKHIIENHFIKQIDPHISLVKEANPIRVEMIVRAYLTGSMWRGYKAGQRDFCGVVVPDGMTMNEKFPKPILTPTTKDKDDTEITETEIIKRGLASKSVYQKMKKTALELFQLGSDYLEEKGIILVDTKYEFGLIGKKLILIDEIHTPDSSRFWDAKDYKKNPKKADQISKEFVRQWLIKNKKGDHYPDTLPEKVVAETTKRYQKIYELITEQEFVVSDENIKNRIKRNMIKHQLIDLGFIGFVMGSQSDLDHAKKIAKHLDPYKVGVDFRIMSAHKNGERIAELAEVYNNSIDPVVVIAIAGRSNGLGGALAANLSCPVINCPPSKDKTDLMLNINSSLIMPSKTPALTVIDPSNAAEAAVRCLNVTELIEQINNNIVDVKNKLADADKNARNFK